MVEERLLNIVIACVSTSAAAVAEVDCLLELVELFEREVVEPVLLAFRVLEVVVDLDLFVDLLEVAFFVELPLPDVEGRAPSLLLFEEDALAITQSRPEEDTMAKTQSRPENVLAIIQPIL